MNWKFSDWFAERSRYIRHSFREHYQDTQTWPLLAALLAVTLGIFLFARYYPRWRRRVELEALWQSLVRAHGLTLGDQELLAQVVEGEGLANRLEIFVTQSVLDRWIARASGGMRERLKALANRLYT